MRNNDTNIHQLQSNDIDLPQIITTYAQDRSRKRNCVIFSVIGVILIISAVIITTTIVLTKKKTKTPATLFTIITTDELLTTTNWKTSSLLLPQTTTIEQTLSTVPIITVEVNGNTTWERYGITVAGGYGGGSQLNQLSGPIGFDIDDDFTIYIADQYNHRIVRWMVDATQGEIIAGGCGQGNRIDQLDSPLDVAIDKQKNNLITCDSGNDRLLKTNHHNLTQKPTIILTTDCYSLTFDNNGYLYILSTMSNEVKRWNGESYEVVIKSKNGWGSALDQFNYARFIFVDNNDGSIYLSDTDNYRVTKWMKNATESIVVAGGYDEESDLNQLNLTRGIIVDKSGNVYVADHQNERIMRFFKGSQTGHMVAGENSFGIDLEQLFIPEDILFDREGNLYVVDSFMHRVQKFSVDERH